MNYHVEKRSDIYVVLPDERLGFKFRNFKDLELKTMTQKSQKDQSECWRKASNLGRHSGDALKDLNALQHSVKLLDDKKYSKVKTYCGRLTAAKFSELCVRVEKARTMISKGFFNSAEQTDISFKILGEERWRSICIEGGEKRVLKSKDEFLAKAADAGQRIVHVGGYPGFLLSRLQAAQNSKFECVSKANTGDMKEVEDEVHLGKLVNISISTEQLRIQVEFPEEKIDKPLELCMNSGSTVDAFITEVTKHMRSLEGVPRNRLKLILPSVSKAQKDREFYLCEVDSKYLTLGSLLKQSSSIVNLVIESK